MVVVLQDRWDAFLVFGQLLNSQSFNAIVNLTSEVLWGKIASRKEIETWIEVMGVFMFAMFLVDGKFNWMRRSV